MLTKSRELKLNPPNERSLVSKIKTLLLDLNKIYTSKESKTPDSKVEIEFYQLQLRHLIENYNCQIEKKGMILAKLIIDDLFIVGRITKFELPLELDKEHDLNFDYEKNTLVYLDSESIKLYSAKDGKPIEDKVLINTKFSIAQILN